ncbi:ATP-binding protein [Kitasatospora sp. P5_F3]
MSSRRGAPVDTAQRSTALQVWESEFPACASSVGLARRWVRLALEGSGWAPLRAGDVVLICSELVTNVLDHASDSVGPIPLRLQEVDGDCRLEVTDGRADLHPVVRPSGVRGHGQGLRLVEELADDWGVMTRKGQKVVWVRVLHGDRSRVAA